MHWLHHAHDTDDRRRRSKCRQGDCRADQQDDRRGHVRSCPMLPSATERSRRAQRHPAAARPKARRHRHRRYGQCSARRAAVTYLLDVNVLIALVDPAHVGHDAAHRWFTRTGSASWATCPITENGVIRIIGHPKYPNSAGSPAAAAPIVSRLRALPGHRFWNDDLSIVGSELIDVAQIATPGQVTDAYLLALAVANGGQLATFDRRLATKSVRRGKAALHVIDSVA